MMKRKGLSYSVVSILALMGVLGIAIWSAYQLSVGSRFGVTITERTPQDMAVSKLEHTKILVEQALRFGTIDTALTVAEQGGTKDPVTYWYCNGEPQPPEQDEVEFALSNTSLSYLNSYIKTLKEDEDFKKLGVRVSEYDCVGIYPPTKSYCLANDCENFGSGCTGGFLEVTDPAYVSYGSGIEVGNNPIRFWMVYFRLYDFFKNRRIMDIIMDSVRGQCPGPSPMDDKVKIALEDVCDKIEQLLDPQYVTCEVIDMCKPDDLSCLNAPCERYFDEKLCYRSAGLAGEQSTTKQDKISFQGLKKRVKFKIEDHKFKPLGNKDMIWNIYAVVEIGQVECVPID